MFFFQPRFGNIGINGRNSRWLHNYKALLATIKVVYMYTVHVHLMQASLSGENVVPSVCNFPSKKQPSERKEEMFTLHGLSYTYINQVQIFRQREDTISVGRICIGRTHCLYNKKVKLN